MSAPFPGCAGHTGVSTELRALAHAVLDRVEPALHRLRDQPPPASASGPSAGGEPAPPCAICPVCSLVAVLRGERPELVARLAEHAAGLACLVREVLDEPAPSASPPSASPSSPSSPPSAPDERTASGSPRRAQRIPVERVGARG